MRRWCQNHSLQPFDNFISNHIFLFKFFVFHLWFVLKIVWLSLVYYLMIKSSIIRKILILKFFLVWGINSSIDVIEHHNKQLYHQLYKSRCCWSLWRERTTKCFCSPCAPNINLTLLICWDLFFWEPIVKPKLAAIMRR